jgi:hypothetical protein
LKMVEVALFIYMLKIKTNLNNHFKNENN